MRLCCTTETQHFETNRPLVARDYILRKMASEKIFKNAYDTFKTWCLYLVLLSSLHNVSSQRTYMRTCDCEYVVDGKCAYTLLLPLNKGKKLFLQKVMN